MSNTETGLPSKSELQAMTADELLSFVAELSDATALDHGSESGQKLIAILEAHGDEESPELTQDERDFIISLGLAEEEELGEIA